MSLTSGQSLSFYEILGPLGAGGMGEVYLARDTRLEREVAIKVLPEELADDDERLRRFEREAKTLASLNHPNVAGIHNIDKEGDTFFLAMELVPGEDLEERLKRGRLPLDEALDVCRQIAEGLEAAHEAGVVHRDLKPANVRITPEGAVKILDFGLAKPIGPKARQSGTSSAQSDSFLVTSEGMILGTPTYMSPEQARGKPVDRRTDIWAFGCVLFECLTGKRAFQGDAFGDLIVAILEHEVDLAALPPATPLHVQRLIRRCLIKDSRERMRDIGEARLALAGPAEAEATPVAARPRSSMALALAGWIVAAGLLVFSVSRLGGAEPETTSSAPSVYARVLLPSNAELAFGAAQLGVDNNLLALSPDGRLLVYVGRSDEGETCLYAQELASFDPPVAIPGTEGALHAFFSPDGSAIGFLTDDRLKRVSPIGDGLLTICEASSATRGQWTADDMIYFGANVGRLLQRVPAAGGDVETLASQNFVVFMEVLPDGKSALMLDYTGKISMDFADITRLDLETFETRVVLENAQDARYVSPGELVFARAGSLHAIPFDAESGEVRGEAAVVLRNVVMDTTVGLAQFVFSADGTMAFVEGPDLGSGGIAWLGRDGTEGFLPVPERVYGVLDLDSTDTRLAVQVADFEDYVWSYDLADERGRRLPGRQTGWPVWSSGGEAIAYSEGDRSIRIESMDGSTAGRSFPVDRMAIPGSWSPDDEVLAIYGRVDAVSQIGFLDVSGGSDVDWVQDFGRNAWGPAFSPDGKWIAYSSEETGLSEIWVRSYPDGSVQHQVSQGGGLEVVWPPCGELFYRRGDSWMSVEIQTEPVLKWSAPHLAFETDFVDTGGRSFDVTSDGQKLYVIKQPNPPDGSRINVITNWRGQPRTRAR